MEVMYDVIRSFDFVVGGGDLWSAWAGDYRLDEVVRTREAREGI